jgi:ABC-type polysaccharide/polyol phosphate transport system ATPase subunit
VIAIRIREVGRYFGEPVMMDGGAQPREAWRSLLRIAGITPKARLSDDEPLTQRVVTAPGHVLRDISVDIEQGTVTCLYGPSGCGKSVLLKILAGVIAPTRGRVEIYGDVARLLTSGDNVDQRMTAHENIQNFPLSRTATPDVVERFQTEVIDFAELQGFEHVPLRTYSTGMLMRLNVALTLCSTAPILLIDDVFAVGDIAFQQKVVDKLHALCAEGRTLVIASSDDTLIDKIATRILTLGNGQIIDDAPPKRLTVGRPSASTAEFDWHASDNFPENDVVALRAMQIESWRDADDAYLDVALAFEAKVPGARCRPSVTVRHQKKVLFRSLYPEQIELGDSPRFGCTVRIPLHILSSGTYLLTLDMHTYLRNNLYRLKARDAITLNVRHGADFPEDRRRPLLTVAFPWELESMAEAQV